MTGSEKWVSLHAYHGKLSIPKLTRLDFAGGRHALEKSVGRRRENHKVVGFRLSHVTILARRQTCSSKRDSRIPIRSAGRTSTYGDNSKRWNRHAFHGKRPNPEDTKWRFPRTLNEMVAVERLSLYPGLLPKALRGVIVSLQQKHPVATRSS